MIFLEAMSVSDADNMRIMVYGELSLSTDGSSVVYVQWNSLNLSIDKSRM